MIKAILTGHSRGLGAAIAEVLLARGIVVLGIARRKNITLAERFPIGLEQLKIDMGDLTSLASWLAGDELRQFVGNADSVLLINNAGTVQPVGPIEAQDVGTIAQAVTLNVAAPMMLSAALASVVASAGKSTDLRIVHVSSGAGRTAYPGWSIYCATKAALDHHARAAALDQTPHLRICSLAPGIIDTDMQAEIRSTSIEQFPLREKFDALKREGQLVDPAACAKRLVDYLLSPTFGNTPVADLRDAP